MKVKEILAHLASDNEVKKKQALSQLYRRFRKVVGGHLRKAACTDQQIQSSVFHDALINFMQKVELREFEGETVASIGAYLNQVGFFYWTKHPENPKREEIKRGKPKPVLAEVMAIEDQTTTEKVLLMTDVPESEQRKLGVLPEHKSQKESLQNGLRISEKIKKFIQQLTPDCQERISRSDYFQPTYTLLEEKGPSLRIKSEETSQDMQDSSATSARKKLAACGKKLKELIIQALKTDQELVLLIDRSL